MTVLWDEIPSLREELSAVNGIMLDSVKHRNGTVAEGLHSLISGDGKMLRPAFLILSARFGRFRREKILPLAAALEMLHVSTLIHDDVIDDSPVRRGNPTLHTRYGMKDSVLIGDFLLSRCFLLAAEYTSPENAKRIARVIDVLCTAEIEQDEERFRPSPSVRRYVRMIAGKTAMLFSLACHVGAVEADCDRRTAEILRRVGYDVGIAFQIIDDILDYEGSADLLRKPIGLDVREGLCTLPLVYALAGDDGDLARLLAGGELSDAAIAKVVSLVRERGGIEAARADAGRYTSRALREIGRLPPSANRDDLELLVTRLLERRF
jgi:heptaprenyl diphosphate synthase